MSELSERCAKKYIGMNKNKRNKKKAAARTQRKWQTQKYLFVLDYGRASLESASVCMWCAFQNTYIMYLVEMFLRH